MKTYKTLTETYMEVANTIKDQIKSLNRWALSSYGAKDFVGRPGGPIMGSDTNFGPGIQFTVKGGKFKGKIVIGLNGNDLYDIAAVTVNTRLPSNWKTTGSAGADYGKVTLKAEKHDVPGENLVQALDDIIG